MMSENLRSHSSQSRVHSHIEEIPSPKSKSVFNVVQTEITEDRELGTYSNTESACESSSDEIRFLTFNTWGLKFVSKNRRERLHAIADRLASVESQYDIVALQEVWTEEDWIYLDRVCAVNFPYRRIFSSGILTGPGLALLSKVPIKSTFLYRYPINGRPSAFFRGDWYVGKSVAVTLLEPCYPGATPMAILNSHMHAPYALTGDAAYSCHRACQAWEISSLVQMYKEAGYGVVLVGDLNSRPGSLPFKILQHEAGLKDSWECIHGKLDLNVLKKMDPLSQIKIGGTTCDSTLNTWRQDRQPDEACRLDYALIDDTKFQVTHASVEFTETLPTIGSYSDHFAYSATLKVCKRTNSVLEDLKINETEIKHRMAIYNDLRDLVEEYLKNTAAWQAQWRLWHFWASIIVLLAFIAVIVVVGLIAPWSGVIFLVFGIAISVTGTVDGLIGFLFGRNEKRALHEVLYQIQDRSRFIKKISKHD